MSASAEVVVACLAPADQRPEVDPLSGEVVVNDAMASLSAADAAALEYALRAGEAWGARVMAVAAGGASVVPALREAASLGAEVLRVPLPSAHDSLHGPRRCEGTELAGDPGVVTAVLSSAIRASGTPALVVCGDRSSLSGAGAVPAMLAHHLGAAQALGLVAMEFESGGVVLGQRRLDGGWRERIRLTAPAVCSVEAAGVRLRRASLNAALAAASVQVPIASSSATAAAAAAGAAGAARVHAGAPRFYRPRTKVIPPPAGGTHERILSLTGALVQREPPRVVGPVAPAEAARELLEFLRRAGVEVGQAGDAGG
ncbi:MAG TPA: mycofactocin-associated electron transfer flavoprotein beta subunit [Acidimicrobiales bacterium]